VRVIFLVYCIASLFYYVSVCHLALRDIFSYFYSLFMPEVPLNTKQVLSMQLRNYSLADAPYRPWLPCIGSEWNTSFFRPPFSQML